MARTHPEESFGLWAKAAMFILAVIVIGSLLFVILYDAILGKGPRTSLAPQQTAEYLCRSKFEREITNAFLTANPISSAVAGGFDVALKGTSAGIPVTAKCVVRGNQVTKFSAG